MIHFAEMGDHCQEERHNQINSDAENHEDDENEERVELSFDLKRSNKEIFQLISLNANIFNSNQKQILNDNYISS